MTDDKTQRERDLATATACISTDRHGYAEFEETRDNIADAIAEARERGLREAALRVLGLWNGHREFESDAMAISALGEAYDALCTMLGYNPAASTPPATPSADPLHPNGRCTCCGEGRCAWCQQPAPECAFTAADLDRIDGVAPATPPEQPRSAAPPGDARRLLQDLVNAMRGRQAPKRVLAAWDAANAWLMSLPAGTPEAPPRTAPEERADVVAFMRERAETNMPQSPARAGALDSVSYRIEKGEHAGAAAQAKGGG